MAPSKRSRVARLMLKAVRSLPEKEQQVVLEYLFESGLSPPGGAPMPTGGVLPQGAKERTQGEIKERVVLGALGSEGNLELPWFGALGPDQQMIPVRLSGPQHRLLKDWCAANGFPMSVVVRGLVERFLEEREKPAA